MEMDAVGQFLRQHEALGEAVGDLSPQLAYSFCAKAESFCSTQCTYHDDSFLCSRFIIVTNSEL